MGFENDVLEACQGSRDPDVFATWMLGRLESLIGFDSAIIVSVIDSRPRAHKEKKPYLHLLRQLGANPRRYQAGVEKGRAAARRGAYLDTEVYSQRERVSSPFYTDIVRPQGITAQLCAGTEFNRQQLSAVYLCRHDRARFRARELSQFSRMVPLLALAEAALSSRNQLPPVSTVELTPREHQIVAYVRAGFRNQDVARVLGTSPNTVRNQLQRLFEKLHVSNRAELVAVCMRTSID